MPAVDTHTADYTITTLSENLVIIGTASFINDVVIAVESFLKDAQSDADLLSRINSRVDKVMATFPSPKVESSSDGDPTPSSSRLKARVCLAICGSSAPVMGIKAAHPPDKIYVFSYLSNRHLAEATYWIVNKRQPYCEPKHEEVASTGR